MFYEKLDDITHSSSNTNEKRLVIYGITEKPESSFYSSCRVKVWTANFECYKLSGSG